MDIKLGDDVEVSFIGKVTEMKLDCSGIVRFVVSGSDFEYAGYLKNSQILELPKETSMKNIGMEQQQKETGNCAVGY